MAKESQGVLLHLPVLPHRRAARRELLPCDFPGCGRIFSNRQYLNVRALMAWTLGPWRRRGCG